MISSRRKYAHIGTFKKINKKIKAEKKFTIEFVLLICK